MTSSTDPAMSAPTRPVNKLLRLGKLLLALTPVTVAAAVWTGLGHAEAPSGRYTIDGGTVLDTKTGLTWQQGFVAVGWNWSLGTGQGYCASLTLPGTGWRVPSAKELLTLVDEAAYDPAIDLAAFPGTPSGSFMTATPGFTNAPRSVVFIDGRVDLDAGPSAGAPTNYSLRCVR